MSGAYRRFRDDGRRSHERRQRAGFVRTAGEVSRGQTVDAAVDPAVVIPEDAHEIRGHHFLAVWTGRHGCSPCPMSPNTTNLFIRIGVFHRSRPRRRSTVLAASAASPGLERRRPRLDVVVGATSRSGDRATCDERGGRSQKSTKEAGRDRVGPGRERFPRSVRPCWLAPDSRSSVTRAPVLGLHAAPPWRSRSGPLRCSFGAFISCPCYRTFDFTPNLQQPSLPTGPSQVVRCVLAPAPWCVLCYHNP